MSCWGSRCSPSRAGRSSPGSPRRRRSPSPPGGSGLALLVVMPFAARGIVNAVGSIKGRACAAGAGILLAAHFATWIASLEHTTVARSVLFVCTSPIWVALIEFAAGRGFPARATLVALALALAGAVVVSGGGHGGAAALRGDLLALAGGVAMAGYFLLSREAQATVPFRAYLGIAYGVAAAVLWLAVLGRRRPGIRIRCAHVVGTGGHGGRVPAHRPQRLQLVAAVPLAAVRRGGLRRRAGARVDCSPGGSSARRSTGAPVRAES